MAKCCNTSPSSVGDGARIAAYGCTWISAQNFRLAAQFTPPASRGVLFLGHGQASTPPGAGTLCVPGLYHRLATVNVQASGQVQIQVDLSASAAHTLSAGSTWYFQFWYRDPSSGSISRHDTSDSLRATFAP